MLWMCSSLGFSQVDIRKNAEAFSKGIECKYKEDVQGAITHFEEALKYMPDDAASMFELSEQYVRAGRMDEGFAMSKKAAELDPENKWYQMRLGMFYRNREQFEEFADIYERLTVKYPDDITLLSDGIYTAMLTTVGGLVVGIIAYFGYNWLTSKVSDLVYKMESSTLEFVDIVLHEPGEE